MFEKIKSEQISNVVIISEITKSQVAELKRRVISFNGLIRIFVHPYYEEYEDSKCWRRRDVGKEFPRIEFPAIGLNRIISLPITRTPPVFVFEEQANMEKTLSRLEETARKSRNLVYLVPTQYNNSNPQYKPRNFSNDWSEYIDLMKKVGVRRILIGGQRFIVMPDGNHYNSKGASYQSCRCVGGAIDHLDGLFQIDISHLAHPHARRDVENVGPDYAGANYKFDDLL